MLEIKNDWEIKEICDKMTQDTKWVSVESEEKFLLNVISSINEIKEQKLFSYRHWDIVIISMLKERIKALKEGT